MHYRIFSKKPWRKHGYLDVGAQSRFHSLSFFTRVTPNKFYLPDVSRFTMACVVKEGVEPSLRPSYLSQIISSFNSCDCK